jgi:hypothetical protein
MRLDHTATGVSPPAASIDYLDQCPTRLAGLFDREALRTGIAA